MAITAALVKELRDKTSAGMMECKKALVETNGDMEAAIKLMRESGLAKADKKSDRVAAEGRVAVAISDDLKTATIIEVNCETDFVSKGDVFGEFSQNIANAALSANSNDIDKISSITIGNETIDNTRRGLITTLGENMNIRRAANISSDTAVSGYVHGGGKIGVIVSATCDESAKQKTETLLKGLAMHISAMKPTVLSYTDLEKDFVEQETIAIRATIDNGNEELERLGKPQKRIPDFVSRYQLTEEALASVEQKMKDDLKEQGKPEKIWDKIIPGQIARYISDNTQLDKEYALLSQAYVLDDTKNVEEAIAEIDPSIKITEFVRYELGDGIEKKEDNFVEEVMAQAKG